jgi:hypothetical protein
LEAVEVVRWGYKLHRRDDVNPHHGWPRAKSPRDQRNQGTSGMLGLLSPTPTMADASSPPCSLTHRIDAAFSFLSSMRSYELDTTKKKMCR